jgi:two-component system, cell cycle sensor histidine kinase and response regulator CckA
VATVSNARLHWQAVGNPQVPLDALPFPAAIVDRGGAIAAANSEWLTIYPNSVFQPSAIFLGVIQEVASGAKPKAQHQEGGERFDICACNGGALLVRQESQQPEASVSPSQIAPPQIAPPQVSPLQVSPSQVSPSQVSQSQKMETVGRLTGGVAHDFANLLTLIAGYSDILLNRISENDPLRPELDEIRNAANRGSNLTSQLLGYTRSKASQPEVIDLNLVIGETERMLRPIIGEDIQIETSLAPHATQVWADPGQMEQVIMNLILNARDAMPGGGRVRIVTGVRELDAEFARMHAVKPGASVILSISDTGNGIEPAALGHVFEPFFTTKEKGKGTGLGLTTVHRIIRESGGDIWVGSEAGHGATFSICLPQAKQAAERGETPAAPRPVNGGHETILLVEDEEGVRRLLSHILHKRGYQVLEASDGDEALRIFAQRASEIELVLTDMVMPHMSGRELAERIRQERPDLKVVFMSGYTDDVLVRTGALSPGMSFLQKPLRPEVLASKLREALDSPARPFNPR